jgi:hypothetical protein
MCASLMSFDILLAQEVIGILAILLIYYTLFIENIYIRLSSSSIYETMK